MLGGKMDMVTHTFHPSIQETKAEDLFKFEASLVYIMSSKTAKTTV